MDSSLEALARKGNLSHALALYNPLGSAETVVHFTPFPSDAKYAAQFAERHIEVFPFFDGRLRGKLASAASVPGALRKVMRKIRASRLNVIRGRLPYFGSFIGCVAGRLLGVPSVVSLGGDNRLPQEREGRYYFGSRVLSYGVEHAVWRMCDAIIVPNDFTRNYVARMIGETRARRKAVVIPWVVESAIPGELSPPAIDLRSIGLEPERPLVLLAGHLNRYKYSAEMFEVASSVLRERPGAVQFVICGDGPLRADGERRLAGVEGVRFLGWQSNDVVLAIMQAAAVVLVPMSGFVLLEAASLGRPVIASDVEWHGEMIVNDATGWLLPPEDVDRWGQTLLDILDRPAYAAQVGTRLKELFRTHYAPDAALGRELALYATLIGRGLGTPQAAATHTR